MIENDLLSQTLGLMRITGSLLLVETYSPPWAVAIPDQARLMHLLNTGRDTRIAAFHFAQRGEFELNGADSGYTRFSVHSGDVVVSFGGMAHTLSQGSDVVPIPLEEHLKEGSVFSRPFSSKGAPTALICGVFLMRDTHLNPLFAGLPAFLHLEQAELAASGLSLTVPELLAHEITNRCYGSDYAMERLLELMCMDILRTYLLTVDDKPRGWLRSIQDPILGKALYRFHEALDEPWSVSRLAAEVNLSPSRFAARFSEGLGESCMTYITKWRLNVARNLLHTTDESIDEIAHRVGYENMPAFTRVFKRYIGTTPGQWRKQQLIQLE